MNNKLKILHQDLLKNLQREHKFILFVFYIFLLLNACTTNTGDRKSKEPNVNVNIVSKVQNIEISYYKNEKHNGNNFNKISIIFTIGFDDSTNFVVYKNKEIIKKFRGITNYSIGVCCDNLDKICGFDILYSEIKVGDSIKIETNNELAVMKIPIDFNRFNRLIICKNDLKWSAYFENNTELQLLE
jgi:hypothetical protein